MKIDFSKPCILPFDGGKRVVDSSLTGTEMDIEIRGDDLYLDGKKVEVVKREEITSEDTLIGAQLIDFLLDHPEMYPESWKEHGDAISCLGDTFTNSGRGPYIRRCLWFIDWENGRQERAASNNHLLDCVIETAKVLIIKG